ncbi:hypothetical protein [Jannaschia sp. Os4]|nr:hypothetical protein [Jannaschia sp. Os4]
MILRASAFGQHLAFDGQPPNVVYRTGTTIMQPNQQQTRRVA